MFLKIICSLALLASLGWLFINPSIQPMVASCVAAITLFYNLFQKKEPPKPSNSNSFNIKSGKGSMNNQSTGTINVNTKNDARR
jgi:hypothetical protein